MRISWAQPSLSRDFTLLSGAVLFVLALVSGWVTYKTYENHYDKITGEMAKEAIRIERIVSMELGDANYFLASLGRQIVTDPDRDYTKLAKSLTSFDSKNSLYVLLSWTDVNKRMVISSNRGVLEEPVDISDRDFIQQASMDSWKMHIGRPIEGRVSGKWVVPASMGITDYTGKFIGIISVSMDIGGLTERIRDLVKRDGVSFAVINREQSKDFITLTEVSDDKAFVAHNFSKEQVAGIDFDKNTAGLIVKGSLAFGSGTYVYYRAFENFPYIVLLGYDVRYSDEAVQAILWARLLQIFIIAIFFVLLLWIVRVRVINPVLDITSAMGALVRGEKFSLPARKASIEMEALASQVRNVSQYIDEKRRIENELRNKMFALKKAKENADFNVQSKTEFLAYIAQEMRVPVNNIIGFAQVLRDQVYGVVENRKYKQYANDIYLTANRLITKIQDVMLYSKVNSDYITLHENTLEISGVINASLRQIADKLYENRTSVNVILPDNLPKLVADDFRLQQVIISLLLLELDGIKPDSVITFDVAVVSEHRDRRYLVFTIGKNNLPPVTPDYLQKIVADNMRETVVECDVESESDNTNLDLRIGIAKTLVSLHGGILHTEGGEYQSYLIIFPASNLVFKD